MKKIKTTATAILFSIIIFAVTSPASAQESISINTDRSVKVELAKDEKVVQEVSTLEDEMIGYIDWENNVVYGVGDGVPPKSAVNPAQARALAKRAAIDTAMARLLETVQEVRVDSESTTRNYITENYVVQTRVSGLIKNAVIDELRQAEDGSYQVRMRMPIQGGKGLSATLLPFQMQKAQKVGIATVVLNPTSAQKTAAAVEKKSSPQSMSDSTDQPTALTKTSAPDTAETVIYTGLIINASGLGASPGMYPNIKTGSGTAIYNIAIADPNASVTDGLCAYRKSIEQARKIESLGDSPLLVKAAEVDGTNKIDLIIEDADGEKIIQANVKNGFLKQARVAIVID